MAQHARECGFRLTVLSADVLACFEELSGNKQKDIFKNEYWKYCVKTAKLKAKDIVNRKQVLLYGRTFWKLSAVSSNPPRAAPPARSCARRRMR